MGQGRRVQGGTTPRGRAWGRKRAMNTTRRPAAVITAPVLALAATALFLVALERHERPIVRPAAVRPLLRQQWQERRAATERQVAAAPNDLEVRLRLATCLMHGAELAAQTAYGFP